MRLARAYSARIVTGTDKEDAAACSKNGIAEVTVSKGLYSATSEKRANTRTAAATRGGGTVLGLNRGGGGSSSPQEALDTGAVRVAEAGCVMALVLVVAEEVGGGLEGLP